jgi:hypothetical protein
MAPERHVESRRDLKYRFFRAKRAILMRNGYTPSKARHYARVAWDRVKKETK